MWNYIQRPFLWQSKLFLRKSTVSFIYLWVSSGLFRRVGITGIRLQLSVFRLHVALIDFSPSLLKCIINQYSNKSSFILEKCSFQLSGHEVLVSSVRSRESAGPLWPWASSAQWLIHDCASPSWHNNTYIINIICKLNHHQQHLKCGVSHDNVDALVQPDPKGLISILCFLLCTHNDNFIVHEHFPGKEAMVYMRPHALCKATAQALFNSSLLGLLFCRPVHTSLCKVKAFPNSKHIHNVTSYL